MLPSLFNPIPTKGHTQGIYEGFSGGIEHGPQLRSRQALALPVQGLSWLWEVDVFSSSPGKLS